METKEKIKQLEENDKKIIIALGKALSFEKIIETTKLTKEEVSESIDKLIRLKMIK